MAGLEFRLSVPPVRAESVVAAKDRQTLAERVGEALSYSRQLPFDAPASWWNDPSEPPPPRSRGWAHTAARAVMAELQGREVVRQALGDVPEHLAKDAVRVIEAIILECAKRRR